MGPFFADVTGANWPFATPSVGLADGVYTLVATQDDNSGDVGIAKSTFTVGNPPAGPNPTPPGPGAPGTQTTGTQSTGTPGGSTPGMESTGSGTPIARQANAGLRVLVSHLRRLPAGCAQHPRPRHLTASACSLTALVSGRIDPRAAGQRLTITWRDGRGDVVHATAMVGRRGTWSIVVRVPAAAQIHPGSVLVTYTGSAKLLAASTNATIARVR